MRLKEEGKMILFSQCKRFFICVSTQNNGDFLEIICVYHESLYIVTEDESWVWGITYDWYDWMDGIIFATCETSNK